jgi:hypothetical protein
MYVAGRNMAAGPDQLAHTQSADGHALLNPMQELNRPHDARALEIPAQTGCPDVHTE